MDSASRINARHALWLFTITLLIYISTTSGVLEFGDDWSMLYVTSSIVDRHQLIVPDATPGSTVNANGQRYSKYGIGQSLMAIPFYVAGVTIGHLVGVPAAGPDGLRQATPLTVMLSGLGMLSTAASVALFFLCLRTAGFSMTASRLTALALGLGTFSWYWALTFMSEPPSMLLLLVAFYAQLRDAERPSLGWLALSGAALGFALLVRIAAVSVVPGFGLWLLWEIWRSRATMSTAAQRIAAWTIPVLTGIAGVAAYNYARFRSVTDIGYGDAARHLGGSIWVGLYGVFFSPGRSLFLYAPILMASALGVMVLWRARPRIALATAAIVVPYLLFHSRLPYWDGGGCWSPRYEAIILPFLLLGLPALIDRGMTRTGWFVLTVLGSVSVGVQLLGVTVSCIPYASRMLQTPAGTDRLMWHPAYSPLGEHFRVALARELPLHVAAVILGSNALAWIQGGALVAGLLLLSLYARSTLVTAVGAAERASDDR